MQHRSSQLSEDLFSCCALPPAGHDSAAAPAGSTWLLGGSRGTMLAYSAAAGRLLGSWAAHDDASSCCCVLGAAPTTLLTGSWDCSVKVSAATGGKHCLSLGGRQGWVRQLVVALMQQVLPGLIEGHACMEPFATPHVCERLSGRHLLCHQSIAVQGYLR